MRLSFRAFCWLGICLAFIAPAAVPAAQQSGSDDKPSRDLVWEKIETAYRFENDGTGVETQTVRIRVLTETGLKGAAQAFFPYSSLTEDLRIDYFRTVKKDGTQIAVDPSKYFDVASPVTQVAPVFSDLKIKAVAAPSLEVGDAVEYQVTHTIRTPLKPGDFWVMHYATRNAVVNSEIVTLDVPAGRQMVFKADPKFPYTTEEKAGRKIYHWETSNPKPQPASDDETPKPMFAASTLSDWKQFGEWFSDLQKGRTEVTPEIRALAEKLTAGKNTPREKLEAIYTYVSESIRYVGIEFGVGGFQAHAAADVLRNGYGDCKDKVGLLNALLAAVGIKSYPALVYSSGGVIEPDVPIPAQFDHAISAVPMDGNILWLDTTLELAPMGVLSESLRGKQALLVEPGATRLADIPEASPVPSRLNLDVTGELDAMGKLTLEDSFSMQGIMEVLYRAVFRSGNKKAISSVSKLFAYQQLDSSKAEDPTSSDPSDLTGPFTFKFASTAATFIEPLDNEKDVQVPHVLITKGELGELYQKFRDREDQKTVDKDAPELPKEIKLGSTSEVEESFDIKMDPSYDVQLPLPIHIDRDFATYDSNYSFEKGHLKTRRTVQFKLTKIPADQWKQLESFDKLIDRDLDQVVQIRRTKPLDMASGTDSMTADQLAEAGKQAFDRGSFTVARELLEKATVKDPKHDTAWNNLGRVYARLKMRDKAEQAFLKQIEINSSDEYAYNNLGLLYNEEGKYDKAIEEYKKQIEINPFDKYVYPNLAATYVQLKRYDDAAAAYEKARAVLHDDPMLMIQIGTMYLKWGKPDEALQRFDRAMELSKRNPLVYNDIAYALAEQNVRLDKAQEYAESAVSQMATVLQSVSFDQTPPTYMAMLNTLASYLDTLGWVYFDQGKFEDASACILPAFSIRTDSVLAEHLARIYVGMNKPDEALRYFAYAWTTAPDREKLAPELTAYIKEKFGDPEKLGKRLTDEAESLRTWNQIAPPDGKLAWPAGAENKGTPVVSIQVVVDEKGNVVEAHGIKGEEPFLSQALTDAKKFQFTPIAWPHQALRTVRSVDFYYITGKHITAEWQFGSGGGMFQTPGPLVEKKDDNAGDNADSQPPVLRHSPATADETAHDADSEFTIGAQLEAKAIQATDKKVAREDYAAALAAYKQAHDMEPENKSYKEAYERLLHAAKN